MTHQQLWSWSACFPASWLKVPGILEHSLPWPPAALCPPGWDAPCTTWAAKKHINVVFITASCEEIQNSEIKTQKVSTEVKREPRSSRLEESCKYWDARKYWCSSVSRYNMLLYGINLNYWLHRLHKTGNVFTQISCKWWCNISNCNPNTTVTLDSCRCTSTAGVTFVSQLDQLRLAKLWSMSKQTLTLKENFNWPAKSSKILQTIGWCT